MSPFKIILLFTALAGIGFLVIPRLTVDLQPVSTPPKITVSFNMPGSPPEIVEQEATAPLESSLAQLTRIKSIYSVSNYGYGSIEITFDNDTDMGFKKFEVSSLMRRLYPELNSAVSYPMIEQRGREQKGKGPLLIYRINANMAPFQIWKAAEDLIIPTLSRLENVDEAILSGAEGLQISIAYDQNLLNQYGLAVPQISETISQEFRSIFPGFLVSAAGQKLPVKAGHTLSDPGQLENVCLVAPPGQLIPLRKIAKVYLEQRRPQRLFRINGLNSITLSVYPKDGINRLTAARAIKQQVVRLSRNLPEGFEIEPDYDDTEFLASEIDKNFFRAGLSLAILLAFVLLSYRNARHLLILFSGLLITLGLTALGAWVFAVSIHLYTIAGVTISFGLIIDNAIVVADHLHRKNDKKIVLAVMGATLTTLLALLLVFFLPKEDRQNLDEFCIIVSVALSCSVLVAVFYTPAIHRLVMKERSKSTKLSVTARRRRVTVLLVYFKTIKAISRYRKLFIVMLILAFGIPVFMLPAKWEGHAWYNNSIGSEFYQETLRPYIDKSLGGALRLFVKNAYERSGYREPERTRLYVQAELPYGNTLETMDQVIRGMEESLRQVNGIEKYVSEIHSPQHASIAVTFDKAFENGFLPYGVKNRLIARSLDWSGVTWRIYGVGQGFSSGPGENLPAFRVEMKGYNYDELEHQAEVLAGKLLEHSRIQVVNTNERLAWDEKPMDQFVLDFQHSSAYAASPMELGSALRQKSIHTVPDLFLSLDGLQFPVFIQPAEGTLSKHDLMEGYLIVEGNKPVRLATMASLNLEKTSSAIHKEDRQYIRVVGFEYFGGARFGNEYLDKVLDEMKLQMPAGYTAEKISWSWTWERVKRQYGLLLLLAVGIYFTGAILFESLRQPLYIIVIIPLSFIGLFLAFTWGDFYFDQGGYSAFVLLGGLVVNAAIFVVNDLNNAACRNYNRAVIKAVAGKSRPILLTVLSTCFGLIPFLEGGQNEVFWFALAIGTIGGLIASLPAVWICLPVFLFRFRQG